MNLNPAAIEQLKQRAKAGDQKALQELRDSGFFEQKKRARKGYAVSHAQERLWLLDRMNEGSTAYNVPGSIVLRGQFDASLFWGALREIIQRHEALRTTFGSPDGEVRQFIHDEISLDEEIVDLTDSADPMQAAKDWALREAAHSFDLQRGPLLRAKVLRIGEDAHVFLFNLHHIICDEWSLGILISELSAAYEARLQKRESPLAPLKIQYKDFAAWQNKKLSGDALEPLKTYWHQKLAGDLPRLDLPLDYPRPVVQTNAGATVTCPLNPDAFAAIQTLGQKQQASLFVTLTALVKTFLYRYSGQDDLVIGAPFAGRTHPDVENMIGFFVNTLCLRDSVCGDGSFVELLNRVQATVTEAIAHQDYPFDQLVSDLETTRDPSRSHLFDVVISLQHEGAGAFRLGEATGESLESGFDTAKFDLIFDFTESPDGLLFRINYNTDLFSEETIQRMGAHFSRLLDGVAAQPEAPINHHPIVSDDEARRMIYEWNATPAAYPETATILSLFEEQTKKTPERTAVVFGEQSLTYRELNQRANQIARRIQREIQLGFDERIAIFLDRSDWMVAVILGVQKAGAAYVPVDPTYPQERIRFMLDDCGCRLVVSETHHQSTLRELAPSLLCVDVHETANEDASEAASPLTPDSAAYVIYTSGSTGKPKGCVVTHRNVVRLMVNDRHPFDFNEDDVWVVAHSFCFDFSVWEMYGALLYGGKLVVAPRDEVRNVEAFHELLRRHRVTVLNQTPAAFYNLIAQEVRAQAHSLDPHLRYVIFGGDRLEATYLRPWVERYPLNEIKLINMYGITETTVHVTYYEIQPRDVFGAAGVSPIGTPIPGTTVFVCNDALQLQPPGVAGEILVGGDGVCREYLNREPLTRERFIENPFESPGRLYRSGDVGRWFADGRLEHLGRNDDQVQVRGFRVELGEIESAVAKHPAVDRCVALAQGDDATSMQLVAYIAPDPDKAAPLKRILRSIHEIPDDASLIYELPNGLTIAHQNKSESDFLYEEIFTHNAYLKYGIEIHDGDCIVDVGGNIGLFSVFAALQEKNITLYSFEPIPPVYECLRKNLQWYSPPSRAFEMGLSDKPGQARFVYFPYNTVVSGKGVDSGEVREVVKTYLVNELTAQGREITDAALEDLLEERMQSQEFDCRLETLSNVIREQSIERIDLLKVDVEQSELEVLLGIDERDWDKIAQVVIEVHDVNGRLDTVTNVLKQRGFSLQIEQDALLQNTNLYNVFALRTDRNVTEIKQSNLDGINPSWCGESSFAKEIRKTIAPLLPDYMAPSSYIFVEEFPLTANGKIDRKALAALAKNAQRDHQQFVAPRNEKEERLAGLWRSVLEREDIGAFDNFFERGGHSLKATQLVAKIHQEMNVKIPLRLVFQHPTLAGLAQAIEPGHLEAFRHIEPAPGAARYPLSHGQRRLWLIERMGANRLAYMISEAFRAPGDLDAEALRETLGLLIARHESLRTVIVEEHDEPWQVVQDAIDVPFEIFDQRSALLREDDERELILSKTNQPFDLANGPLFRVALFRFAEQRNIVLFSIHHSISDGWSMNVLLDEWAQLYEAHRRKQPSPLAGLRLQYKDYAVWQKEWLQSNGVESARRFWLDQFKDEVSVLELPTDRPRPVVQSFSGGVYSFELEAALAQRLWMFGRDRGASAFVTVLAAVYALLFRYANQDDVVVGSPVAGREHADLEGLVGFFVNMLPLRSRINGDAGFAGLLEQTRDAVAQALTYQAYPFDRLVDELELHRDLSRSPLFDVAVTLHNQQTQDGNAVAIEAYPLHSAISKFDLTFFFSELPNGRCGVGIEYNADLFEPRRIEGMARHFCALVASALAAPQKALHSLPVMSDDERRRVIENFNDAAADYPKTLSVAELFERQAEQTPNATALICGDDKLTYQQLNQKGNALATRLCVEYALQPEECVGVLMERSQGPVIAALAILKAGGAYVPLDPAYPQSRIQYMVEDAQCRIVLSDAALIETYSTILTDIHWVDAAQVEGELSGNPSTQTDGSSLAYVIYTSGSTGEPKGSLIEQRSITRLVKNTNYIQINQSDCILQTGSLSFDASTFEIWGALLNGASVCMPHEDDLLEPARLAALIETNRVSILFLTTSLFNQYAEAQINMFGSLRVLLTGGEKVSVKHINRVRAHCPDLSMLHVYGPTENTTFSTYYSIEREQVGDAPIGMPIANSTVYILDAHGGPQPVGVPGEICVGGDGVARGYLNRDALTREKFVADPFRSGASMYKTGDQGVWNDDGTVSFIGRIDNQVKVRGFRVEPGEIEIRLQAFDEIDQAAVEARLTSVGTKELVAYYAAARSVSAAQLRERLSKELPDYMVPSRWVELERLPLNRNGKIDRKKLPEPGGLDTASSKDAAPRNETEQALLDVWRSVLGRPALGVHDNYFEAGGDSIRAIQIVSRLRQLGWQAEIRHLFQYLTVAELAPRLSAAQVEETADEVIEGEVKLAPIQQWFFDGHDDDIHHFNQSVMLKPLQAIDADALKEAFKDIWRHHDALRMQFHQPRGAYQQYNRGLDVPIDFEVVDCCGETDETAAVELHAQSAQAGFDLQNTPLMKAALYRTSSGDRILWIVHHLVVDGVSWRILLEDLETAYQARSHNAQPVLPQKTASYQLWAEALHVFSQDGALLQETDYWRSALTQPATALPLDGDADANVYGDCDVIQLELSNDETEQLLTRSHRAYSTEMNDLLLTALARALSDWTSGDAFWITLEGHGREALSRPINISRTVGWFTSMFPFLLRVESDSLAQQIKETKEALRAVPRKGMGYGVLRHLAKIEEIEAPPSQLSFNYLGQFDADGNEGLFSIVDEPCGKTLGARLQRDFDIEIIALVASGRMALSAIYNKRRHQKETVEQFLQAFREQLNVVSNHCSRQTMSELTPSDCTGCSLSLVQFEELLETNGWRASEIADVYPLSPMQQGLLFQSLYQPESQAYFLQMSFRLNGGLSVEAFRQAWFELCQRHAIFRTAFVYDGVASPLQIVLKQREPEWNFESIAALPSEQQDVLIQQKQEDERRRGFHFTHDPLMRIHVYQLNETQYQVIWSYHHLLLDGWCLRIVYQELYQLYGGFAREGAAELNSPPRYGDYIAWLQSQDAEQAQAYWAKWVEGYEPAATIAKRRNASDESYQFKKAEITLDEELTAALQAVASNANVTLNTVVQTGLALALQQHAGRDDVMMGSIVSGRAADVEGVEDMLGLFINAIPVRAGFDGNHTVSDALKIIQNQTLESEAYSYYPLADIQALSGGERDLFDVLMIFANYPTELDSIEVEDDSEAHWTIDQIENFDQTHYDLNLIVAPGARLQLKLHYNGAAYEETRIAWLVKQLKAAFERMAQNPGLQVKQFSILSGPEYGLVVNQWNATRTAASQTTIVDDFLIRVHSEPEAIALKIKTHSLSYAALNQQANPFANSLIQKYEVGADDLVGVLMGRSDAMVAAILGVLKSGAAYVPIDPTAPDARIEHVIQDSGCKVVITEAKYAARLNAVGRPLLLANEINGASTDEPGVNPRLQDLAYVIYTSGSTGLPKGCLIEHRNLSHYLHWANDYYYGERDGGVMGLHSSISIDMTVTSLFLPLLRGKTLHVFGQEEETPDLLAAMFEPGSGFDCVKLTPSHISVLKELNIQQTDVSLAIVGGEALPMDCVRYLHQLNPSMRVVNEYGPTETTVGCIVKEISPKDERVLIGKPIHNTQVYVLDGWMRPAPVGEAGEIYIGGAGVGRGYLNRDDLTQEKFIANPFAADETLYRTGDVGVWLDDGELDYLGRNDDQVKVRGYRVELGEIEQQIQALPGVVQAAVALRDVRQGEPELVAYFVAEGEPDTKPLRAALAKRLPDYCVPRYWMQLDAIPLSPGGKTDKRVLPLPQQEQNAEDALDQPSDETEQQLADIWREVLNTASIGVRDRFFDIGGHSLKAMQTVSRIHKRLGVKLALRDLFEHPTIAELAVLIRQSERDEFQAIEPAPSQEYYELSFAQKRLWFIQRAGGEDATAAYNMPKALLLEGEVNVDALNRAFNQLLKRHEALRTGFVEIDGEPKQVVHDNVEFSVRVICFENEADVENAARQLAEKDAHTPFDLARPPLLRGTLILLDPSRAVFVLTVNHIIGDGWSMQVLFRDLLTFYQANQDGREAAIQPLRIQYKDFALWQNSRSLNAHEAYWLEQLKGKPESVRLPYDRPAAEQDYQGGTEQLVLDAPTVAALRGLAQSNNTTLSNVVLAFFYVLLYQWTRQDDLCVGVSIANRTHPDLEGLIGFFVNILPVRVRASAQLDFDELLTRVMDAANSAYEHQEYPFDLLVQKMNPHRAASRQPLVNVVYGYQNFSDIQLDVEKPNGVEMNKTKAASVSEFDLEFNTSKFDLTLFASESDDGLELNMEYDSARFEPASIRRLLDAMGRFMQSTRSETQEEKQ
ncbi:MAG: amino acid adenylation domain-containing protein [Candidatus Hinthialibacter antarcticus]|nr:amino acid adenylation domain-containing protein [Candidatus Hinthialibacter antarcticus]